MEAGDAPSDLFLVPGLRRHQRRQALLAQQQQGRTKATTKQAAAAVVAGWGEGGGKGGEEEGEEEGELVDTQPVKKTRGRKVGSVNGAKKKGEKMEESATAGGAAPKKRGRKPKVVEED